MRGELLEDMRKNKIKRSWLPRRAVSSQEKGIKEGRMNEDVGAVVDV